MVLPLSSGLSTTKTLPGQRPPFAAFLFDIDGTLVNSDPVHFAVFQELLLKIDGFNDNKPINEDFFRKYISGRQNALITADLFPQWTIPQREQWSIQKEARFREMAASIMMESKMDGLDRLRDWINDYNNNNNDNNANCDNNKGDNIETEAANVNRIFIRRAAVTNAPRLNAEAIIDGIDYNNGFFKALIIGDECEKPKPDPCPYLTACQLLNVEPKNCIIFEDSPSGARAGKASGAYVVGILSGQDTSTLLDAGCDLVVENFDDPLLWNLFRSRLSELGSTDCSTASPGIPV